ncbi:LapA family protein [Microbacterium aurugineum]|uniref:LapA family protein n=1 Tax=Microbacterium aurugineum TaxID=2851642 RepID=UPI0020BE057A|nr:LapA family protein [Microbacterium aurugineum]MCK8478322.1 LapA family protein [Microbacterium aurugineum]
MTEKDHSTRTGVDQKAKANGAKAIIAIIVAIAALAFVFSNVAPATLRFLFLEFTMPAWGWFLAVLAAGVVIGSLFPWFRPRKK